MRDDVETISIDIPREDDPDWDHNLSARDRLAELGLVADDRWPPSLWDPDRGTVNIVFGDDWEIVCRGDAHVGDVDGSLSREEAEEMDDVVCVRTRQWHPGEKEMTTWCYTYVVPTEGGQ
jgi:hypothetical protein